MTERPKTRVRVGWHHGLLFEAKDSAGSRLSMDGTPPFGEGTAMSPMEGLLASLGGCTAMDVVSILKKKRQDVIGYRVELEGVRAEEHPHVFTDIRLQHIIVGREISEEAVRRAIQLSEEKYCSVMAMLRQAANITSTFSIEEAGAGGSVPGD